MSKTKISATKFNQLTALLLTCVFILQSGLDENLLKERDRLTGKTKPGADVPGRLNEEL